MNSKDETAALPDEQIQLFNAAIKNFHIALKNSVFYASDHPICTYSINNFKSALDRWFSMNNRLDLGVTQDDLILNGDTLEKKEKAYGEVANYFHIRGLSALSIQPGINSEELIEFFDVIRNDRKTIQKMGGIVNNIPQDRHIIVKELDYSSLLVHEIPDLESDEGKVWKFLSDVAHESKEGKLPESKLEFLKDFFKDTKKSASALNNIYQQAVNQMQDETAVEDIRAAIRAICEYYEQHASEDARDLKVKLMNVIAQLHPDLISVLFDQTIEGEEADLASEITKGFSESYIAEFIESLISNEDTFNENLLKVFDKLAPDSEKNDNMVMMVADKLFSKRVMNPNTLSKLQMSIMEIFKKHPESNFMNQIYKITVDAVVNKKIDTLVYVAKLSPLINTFVQSIEGEQLQKEKIWLLLNILWLENDPNEFKKSTDKVISILPEILHDKDTLRLRDIVEFFSEKTRPEQRQNEKMIQEIKSGLRKIANQETVDSIISQIPDASKEALDNIAYIFNKTETNSASNLVDAFISEKNPAHRNKFMYIFVRMPKEISNEAMDRLAYCEAHLVRDLFFILSKCAPDKAHLMAKKLIIHKNPQIRWYALEQFKPQNGDEMQLVLKIYKKEKNPSVKKKAALVLLETQSQTIIDEIFKIAERNWFDKKFLMQLIELCGHIRAQESLSHLRRLFLKKALFNTKRRDDMRVAAITSLSRLQTKESMQLVEIGLNDRSKRVREISEITMKLVV